MRNTKQAILTSAFITLISLTIYTIIQFKLIPIPLLVFIRKVLVNYTISDIKEYLIVIFSGIFTGSILSLIIYIKEYQTTKAECLRNYLNVIIEGIKPFYNLEPFITREPLELIKDYYNELNNNESHERFNRQNLEFLLKEYTENYLESYKKSYIPLKHDAKDALSNWIWENTDDRIKSFYQSPDQINKYIDEEINYIIEKYDSLIDVVMKQYINFRSYQIQNLNNAYYELDFIFANKKIRKDIYNNIHIKHLNTMKFIKEKAWNFENYYKSTGMKKTVMIYYIEEIQNAIFKIKTENNSVSIYNQYLYDIDVEIEKLLHIANNKKTERNIPEFKDYLFSVREYNN